VLVALLLLLTVLSQGAAAMSGQAGASRDILRDAAAAHQAGDMATAIRLYRKFLKEYPDAAEIRSNLGAALVENGQFTEAIPEYSAALQKLPNNPRVRMNLALAYYKLGRLPDAVLDLEILHKLQPLELKPALLLADCLLQTGQARKAADLLTPLQEEYPDDHAVIYMLGMALLQENRTADAQVLLDGGRETRARLVLRHVALEPLREARRGHHKRKKDDRWQRSHVPYLLHFNSSSRTVFVQSTSRTFERSSYPFICA